MESLHTVSLKQYMTDECSRVPDSKIDYTFKSKVSYDRSFLDHFLVSENPIPYVVQYNVRHDGDNHSDESPIVLT